MKNRFLIIFAILFLIVSASADARKVRKKRKAKEKKTVVVEDPRIQQMLASTQQITFIDSMVVDRNAFMKHIPLSAEVGTIEQKDSLGQFTNELKDHRYVSIYSTADSACHIATSDYLGNRWTTPVRAEGISDYSAVNPFVMPDGTTLYFAQKGENSIGGYDLFVTRYDSERGAFLKPENLGMPFSSTANDYFYAIDETTSLGYFVTDRNQPEGKVCIYIFIPNESRKVYRTELYTEQQLRSLAAVERITDTWEDNSLVTQGIERLNQARNAQKTIKKTAQADTSDELASMYHQAAVLEKALLLARNFYAKASENDRQTLRHEILNSEKELETLQMEIRKKEKKERNKQYQNN